jgi:hypothetical protein
MPNAYTDYATRARELMLAPIPAAAFVALNEHADAEGTCPSCGALVTRYESDRLGHVRRCQLLLSDAAPAPGSQGLAEALRRQQLQAQAATADLTTAPGLEYPHAPPADPDPEPTPPAAYVPFPPASQAPEREDHGPRAVAAFKALQVLVLDRRTRGYLRTHDPKALQQAAQALHDVGLQYGILGEPDLCWYCLEPLPEGYEGLGCRSCSQPEAEERREAQAAGDADAVLRWQQDGKPRTLAGYGHDLLTYAERELVPRGIGFRLEPPPAAAGAGPAAPLPWFDVIVGNVGSVYSGYSGGAAQEKYDAYVQDSKAGYGRQAGEDVTLFKDGEIVAEHQGTQERD